MELVKEGPYRFQIPQRVQMQVPGIVYASGELIPDLAADRCLEQVANVATLPALVTASYAMTSSIAEARRSASEPASRWRSMTR
jgi:tRNA-splicing ligase RtcB (3'-phosphate/5'-hydroxy nucleic acid ligase)